MKDHKILLRGKNEICENTMSFVFDTSNSGFSFEAGQYAYFTIENPGEEDAKGNSRPLSIASSPHIKDSIMIASRKSSSAFIRNLSALQLGSSVFVSKARGDFRTDLNSKVTSVFIAGGIGITPVRSIIEKAVHENSEHEIYLFYSNKTLSQAAFIDDFLKWQVKLKRFQFIPIFEQKGNDVNDYESGKVSKDILKMYLRNFDNKNFFLVGPPMMVDAVKTILLSNHAGESMIMTEKFEEI